jgi:glycosyltransferase involved in cell wall biosynthesis
MVALSVFITTFNNDQTLERCLESVKWAEEIVVLDSHSTDATATLARRYGCRFFQHEFMGYGPQKQMALEKTSHQWVLLLDADEALTAQAQARIKSLLAAGPAAQGYALPRIEQMFWRMANPAARMNYFLRLFDKSRGRFTVQPIHAAPEVDGLVEKLEAPFVHYGEPDIHTKVAKINGYSTGLVADKVARGRAANPWIMIFYPPLYFLRLYLFKRNFLNGWAGFIASVVSAFYVFLKYAKLYEHRVQSQRSAHDEAGDAATATTPGQAQKSPGKGVEGP